MTRMVLFAVAALAVFTSSQASAHGRHHHRYWHHHHRNYANTSYASEGDIGACNTRAGTIVVAYSLCDKFQSLIAAFEAAGYHPSHVGCFARGGHVRNSRHYAGAACDFDQSGWGRTARFMYHAHEIIVAHGLRDGCEFRDCGHVDDGVSIGTRRYARRSGQS